MTVASRPNRMKSKAMMPLSWFQIEVRYSAMDVAMSFWMPSGIVEGVLRYWKVGFDLVCCFDLVYIRA